MTHIAGFLISSSLTNGGQQISSPNAQNGTIKINLQNTLIFKEVFKTVGGFSVGACLVAARAIVGSVLEEYYLALGLLQFLFNDVTLSNLD